MRILVCGDLHLKPAASDYNLDAIAIADEIDVVLILGDLTHRAGPDDIELARQFVSRMPEELSVVYVPGNHDPAPTEQRILDSISGADSGHRTAHEFDDGTIVGWGCEQRSLSLALDPCEFEALDPRNAPREDRRYAADRIAADIEAAVHDVICGPSEPADIVPRLDIKEAEQAIFYRSIEQIEATYAELSRLLAEQEDVILATHLPPFNTSFDRHHAVGIREEDRESLHMGSIALKLAIREHDVFATFSGHSHSYGYDTGDGADGRPHYLNLGYRGIGTVTLDPTHGKFAFTRDLSGTN